MQDFYSKEPVKEAKTTKEGDSPTEDKFDLSEYVRKERAFRDEQLKKLYNTINAAPAPINEDLKKMLIEANERDEKWRAEHKPPLPNGTPPLKVPQWLRENGLSEKKLPKIE